LYAQKAEAIGVKGVEWIGGITVNMPYTGIGLHYEVGKTNLWLEGYNDRFDYHVLALPTSHFCHLL
jgi:hypothetical protein